LASSLFFILKNISKNICLALVLGAIAFVMIKFGSLEYVLFVAMVSFCADATSTIICTKRGFFEKNPLYMVFQKRFNLTSSIILSGIVYVLFLGVMHYSFDMLIEAITVIGVVHGYGTISNLSTLFRSKGTKFLPLYKNHMDK